MTDRDGLWIFCSLRGTSLLDLLHQYLTTSFGQTRAGPWYTDCLLAIVCHCYN
jgi:hypothetical protein